MEQVTISVPIGRIELPADIALPDKARGLVLFAHGSGSSRHSPRNKHVAEVLNHSGVGTILIDLLTEDEESADARTAAWRFDIPLLSHRLVEITDWIERQQKFKSLPVGYFGASTGAAAALAAAADRPAIVKVIVSRGGRPDLAGESIKRVVAPTLFIVGGEDTVVLDLNRSAMSQLPSGTDRKMEVIAGASHLFEEPGALDKVAAIACDWFVKHLYG